MDQRPEALADTGGTVIGGLAFNEHGEPLVMLGLGVETIQQSGLADTTEPRHDQPTVSETLLRAQDERVECGPTLTSWTPELAG